MLEKNQWVPVKERMRTYHFPGGEQFSIADVIALRVSDSHTHYLKCDGGLNLIVRNTWFAIEIDGQFID